MRSCSCPRTLPSAVTSLFSCRCESWDNYCDLFGLLLTSNVNMQLPNIWLWDMVDEFLYQFQVGPLGVRAVYAARCRTQYHIVHTGGVFGMWGLEHPGPDAGSGL